MQNVAKYLLKSLSKDQFCIGPITPRPGPIFPIDDADIDNAERKSMLSPLDKVVAEKIKVQTENIRI